MKLYVWEYVLTDYTDGIIMFALANSVEEARELIRKEDPVAAGHKESSSSQPELLEEPDVYDSPAGFTIWGGA